MVKVVAGVTAILMGVAVAIHAARYEVLQALSAACVAGIALALFEKESR